MNRWVARSLIGILAILLVWMIVEGGWWLAAAAATVVAMVAVEARWAERWPFRSSS